MCDAHTHTLHTALCERVLRPRLRPAASIQPSTHPPYSLRESDETVKAMPLPHADAALFDALSVARHSAALGEYAAASVYYEGVEAQMTRYEQV